MSNKSVRDEARLYFIPFLLGSNKRSHALSGKIFRKYGIVSFILDEKRSFSDFFDISSSFFPISSGESSLLCEQLVALADREPYTLPLLIPTSPQYERAVSEQTELLQKHFVLCDAERVFTDSPMANIF